MFDLIDGLPVHPLVIHAAVVFIPLTMLGTVVIAVRRSWRRTLGWWVVGLAFATVGFTFVAKESGEALAARVGLPVKHADLGDSLPIITGVMFLATTALVVVDRISSRRAQVEVDAASSDTLPVAVGSSPLVKVLAVVAVLVALGATFQAYRVGDSGARAVWAGQISATSPSDSPTPTTPSASASSSTPTASPSASASQSGSASPSGSTSPSVAVFTMAQVAVHSTASDCWTAIDNKVYDLTSWEDKHPGGAPVIVSLCGTDGTAAFTKKHGTQNKPNRQLAEFQIGVLA